jgi:hypothetical protein
MQSNQNQPEEEDINVRFDRFFQIYKLLGKMVESLPIDAKIKSAVHYHFDTGFLWMKEALSLFLCQQQIQQEKVENTNETTDSI